MNKRTYIKQTYSNCEGTGQVVGMNDEASCKVTSVNLSSDANFNTLLDANGWLIVDRDNRAISYICKSLKG